MIITFWKEWRDHLVLIPKWEDNIKAGYEDMLICFHFFLWKILSFPFI